MKVILGFNEIYKDGMGSAALTLVRALKAQGVVARPVHAWRDVKFDIYEAEAKPIFVEGNEMYSLEGVSLKRMVETVNNLTEEGDAFIHFGSPNWAACTPYFNDSLRIVVAVHSINPSTLKLCRAYADRISAWVCISQGVMERFLRKLPKRFHHKVHLIPNAVEETLCPKTDYTLGNPLRILFVGRIEDTSKGCGKLPKILAELKKRGVAAQLDLYGYFHNWEQQFWAVVDKAGVHEQVNYRGEIAHEQIYPMMVKYDVFIAPSNFEGFPLSISEAMMAGLPCLVSRIDRVTDWIMTDGETGLLAEKMDIKGFADKLELLVRNPGLAEKIGQAGRARIRDLASFKSHGKLYAELLQQVSTGCDYKKVEPPCSLENYRQPEFLKPWGLARLLPVWLKTWLRRFM